MTHSQHQPGTRTAMNPRAAITNLRQSEPIIIVGSQRSIFAPVLKLMLAAILILNTASVEAEPGQWTPVGPNGGSIFTIQVDPVDEATVYAGAFFGGIYKSSNLGVTWQHCLSPFSNSTVHTIAIDPQQAGTLYVGVGLASEPTGFTDRHAGIYKSQDGCLTWTRQNEGLTDTIVESLFVDPSNPDVLLAATTSALFRSTDQAASWNEITDSNGSLASRALIFDPDQQGLAYIGLRDGRGVLRSTDSGLTWETFATGLEGRVVHTLSDHRQTGMLYVTDSVGQAFKLLTATNQWVNISAGLPGAVHLLAHPQTADTIFAATVDGIYLSEDGGQSWAPSFPSTFIRPSILASGTSGFAVYAATLWGPGVLTSFDAGNNWIPTNLGIQSLFIGDMAIALTNPGSILYSATTGVYFTPENPVSQAAYWANPFTPPDLILTDIQAHPQLSDTLLIGTDRYGVWKSTDAGYTWQQNSDGIVPPYIHAISQARTEPYLMYAGTSAGFYVSDNHGASWSTKAALPTVNLPGVYSIAIDPVNPRVAYFGGSGAVYKTVDGGSTENGSFILPSQGLPYVNITALELVQGATDKLYALTENGLLYASLDGGSNWSLSSPAAPVGLSIDTSQQAPDVVYLGTYFGVFKSEDGGTSWIPKSTGLIAPVISLLVDSTDPQIVYAGTYEGIYKSVNGGDSWTAISTGLPIGSVGSIIAAQDNPDLIHISIKDAGIYKTEDGGASWALLPGNNLPLQGDLPIAINAINSNAIYAGTDLTGIYASLDGGVNWFASTDGMSLWVRRLAVHPVNPDDMYAGALVGGIFKSTDGGNSWTNKGLIDRFIIDVVVNPLDSQIVYVATDQGIRRSLDGGDTWVKVGPDMFGLALAINPANTAILYAGAMDLGLFKSVDGGNTWAAFNNGIDDLDIFSLAVDPVAPDTVYAGSGASGVYISDNAGLDWTQAADGMFNKFVLTLEIDKLDHNVIYAGTEGGGIFALDRN